MRNNKERRGATVVSFIMLYYMIYKQCVFLIIYRKYLIYLVQDILQTSNTADVRLLSVHPWSGVGAARVVTDTNIGLESQGGGGVCVTAHGGVKPLLSYITGLVVRWGGGVVLFTINYRDSWSLVLPTLWRDYSIIHLISVIVILQYCFIYNIYFSLSYLHVFSFVKSRLN